MSNPKTNKEQKLPPQQGMTSANTDRQSHFLQARQIIEKWPEWKKNISCTPKKNGNQSTQLPEKP